MAEQGLDHEQVLDRTAALPPVLLGHGDAEQALGADAVEDLAVRRLV